jgi:hypothetical protein
LENNIDFSQQFEMYDWNNQYELETALIPPQQ